MPACLLHGSKQADAIRQPMRQRPLTKQSPSQRPNHGLRTRSRIWDSVSSGSSSWSSNRMRCRPPLGSPIRPRLGANEAPAKRCLCLTSQRASRVFRGNLPLGLDALLRLGQLGAKGGGSGLACIAAGQSGGAVASVVYGGFDELPRLSVCLSVCLSCRRLSQ